MHQVRIDLGLPKSMPPGTVLLIDKKYSQLSMNIDQDPLTVLPNGNLFAISGLTGKSAIYIYGTSAFSTGGFWRAPRLEYFVEKVEIDNPKLQEANPLRLPSAVWKNIPEDLEARIKNERQIMREALQKENSDLRLDCWKVPLRSSVSSVFASPRILPTGKSYYHSGLDLRAAVGYPVRAVANSTVALTADHFVPGQVVVLDHGGGLYSRYMHLSSIEVKTGDVVKQGQIIGRTGATGRVEAPHLHWEVLWKGNYANPQTFLQAWGRICDPKLSV